MFLFPAEIFPQGIGGGMKVGFAGNPSWTKEQNECVRRKYESGDYSEKGREECGIVVPESVKRYNECVERAQGNLEAIKACGGGSGSVAVKQRQEIPASTIYTAVQFYEVICRRGVPCLTSSVNGLMKNQKEPITVTDADMRIGAAVYEELCERNRECLVRVVNEAINDPAALEVFGRVRGGGTPVEKDEAFEILRRFKR